MVRIEAFRPSLIATGLAIVSLVPVAAFAAGPVTNGGFETGNLSGWTASSGASLVFTSPTSILLGAPYEGSYFGALLTSTLSLTGVTATNANTQLGLTTGTLGTTYANLARGVVLTQNVTVAGGSKLDFAYKFSTLEFGTGLRSRKNDVSFFTVTGPGTNDIFTLKDVNAVGSLGNSGWLTDQSYFFANGGNYTIGFGVFNRNDNFLGSALRVDAVEINVVPEPGAIAFGVLAFGAVAGLMARRRRQI